MHMQVDEAEKSIFQCAITKLKDAWSTMNLCAR